MDGKDLLSQWRFVAEVRVTLPPALEHPPWWSTKFPSWFTQAWSCLDWRSPLGSLNPTTPPALLNLPLTHVPKFHIPTVFKSFQGWGLYHCLGQLVSHSPFHNDFVFLIFTLKLVSIIWSPLRPNHLFTGVKSWWESSTEGDHNKEVVTPGRTPKAADLENPVLCFHRVMGRSGCSTAWHSQARQSTVG